MSYRRALLFRWSRRDVLAVMALAAIVAFLTGSALFYVAASDRPVALADEYGSVADVGQFQSVDAAHRAARDGDVVVEYVRANDTGPLVVGMSQEDADRARRMELAIPEIPEQGVRQGVVDDRRAVDAIRLGEQTVNVTTAVDTGVFPSRWYVASTATIKTVGPTGAFVIRPPTPETDVATLGGRVESTIRGSLRFFQQGARQLLNGFVLLVAAAVVLGAVTVTSVVRMTVIDRADTIRVIRAAGGPPSTVLSLFVLRGALLTAVALALGYAGGVIASSVAVSVAVFAGLPTSLSPRVSAEAVRLLTVVYVPLLAVGGCSGALAALPAVRTPPGDRMKGRGQKANRTGESNGSGQSNNSGVRDHVRSLSSTVLLDWRAVVPTAATVAVFTSLVLLVLAGGGVAAPLTTSSATVLEPGAAHPLSSSIPESYASAFESQNVAASPEILVFGAVNDEPALVRGARYGAFAAVSNASIVAGRTIDGPGEALVGRDFADTHGVSVNETVVLGGGVAKTFDSVRVVGAFRAPGVQDDQLLVPIETGRHLSLKSGSDVNFVRLSRPVGETSAAAGVNVLSVSVAGPATTDGVTVEVSVVNLGDTAATRAIDVSLGDETTERTVSVGAGNRTVASVEFSPSRVGTYTLTAAERTRRVDVVDPDSLQVQGVPAEAPVDSAPQIRVETVLGRPVANATVAVGDRSVRTAADGTVRTRFLSVGTTRIRVHSGDRQWNQTVTVSENASRRLSTSLRIVPDQVTAFTRPTATVRFYNPWNRSLSRTFQLRATGERYHRDVTVAKGQTATRSVKLPRLPQGSYRVSVHIGGDRHTAASYRVAGEGRLSTVVARNTETQRGGGLGVAISTIFGNLQVIVGGLLALAAVMVSGALVASFSRTIHARRRTIGIYRATGATPGQIGRRLLREGVVIGSVSVALGLFGGCVLLWVLDARNALVFFGITVAPAYSPVSLALVGASSFGLVLLGIGLSAAAVLRRPPAALLSGDDRASTEESR